MSFWVQQARISVFGHHSTSHLFYPSGLRLQNTEKPSEGVLLMMNVVDRPKLSSLFLIVFFCELFEGELKILLHHPRTVEMDESEDNFFSIHSLLLGAGVNSSGHGVRSRLHP